jgi:YVTN family beta-propeller protein
VGAGPLGVAVDPGTHTVYVANATSHTLSVIKGAKVTATTALGGAPDEVALAGGNVYVVDRTGNALIVITGTAVKSTVRVGADPYDVAVDPGTHTVYVTNKGGNTVSVIKL